MNSTQMLPQIQIIHFNKVFHYFHHPFWGTPIFALERKIPRFLGGADIFWFATFHIGSPFGALDFFNQEIAEMLQELGVSEAVWPRAKKHLGPGWWFLSIPGESSKRKGHWDEPKLLSC